MRVYNGYSHDFTQKSVRYYAERAALGIKALVPAGAAIVVTGNSGVSIAFAALMLLDFPLVLVRKDNDNSHGSPVEGPDADLRKYMILDDFVGTGETVRRTVKKLNDLSRDRGEQPECVGVLMYRRDHRDDHMMLVDGRETPVYGCKRKE